jgi:osmotically-inducible protein OsmY
MGADEIMGSGGSSIELWLSGDDRQIADVRLQEKVWEQLHEEVTLVGADLQVEVTDGVALLDGTVDHYLAKTTAERATRRVPHLRGVESHIRVRSRGSSPIHDPFTHP